MPVPPERPASPQHEGRIAPLSQDTRFEEAIDFILERAASLAADAQPDETFTVTPEMRLQDESHLVGVIGAVMTRAESYGVQLLYPVGWTFHFVRKDPITT